MKIVSAIVTTLLLLISLFYSSETKLIQELNSLRDEHGLIHMNGAQFDKFTKTPRKFNLLVIFTVLDPAYKCNYCIEVDQKVKQISSHWKKNKLNEQLYFVSLDYTRAPHIFQRYEITGAPFLYFYKASDEKSKEPKHIEYNGFSVGGSTDELGAFLTKQIGTEVTYDKPIDWLYVLQMLTVTVIPTVFIYLMYTRFTKVVRKPRAWAASILVFIIAMTSGQMWNSIRGPNYLDMTREGLRWYSGGFQDQLGCESHVVAGLYGVATVLILFMSDRVTKITNPTLQAILGTASMASFVIIMALTIHLFSLKFPGYPYKIPLPFI